MKQLVTGSQMQQLDRYTINEIGIPSLVLMERAARSVYDALYSEHFPLKKVLILCGSGNNGADGVALARMLHLDGIPVHVWILGQESHFTEEMEQQIKIAEKYQISFVKNVCLSEYTTIVDAIFGVGLSREVTGIYQKIIEEVNQTAASVVSVDIPSGIHADTGAVMGCAIHACLTVTFAYEKAGMLLYPGALCSGKIITADIGIRKMPETVFDFSIHACEESDLLNIPDRRQDGNKGTFGKVLLIAGNADTSGAPYLCACAAMHTGAGMIKIHTREENRSILPVMLPESMYSFYGENKIEQEALTAAMEWADVIGIGPGLGTGAQAAELLDFVMYQGRKPLVIDADGLNLIKDRMELLENYKEPVIVTPHLGEFSRISGLSIRKWKESPLMSTRNFAENHHLTVVCKDARTIISDGSREIYINPSGNCGMATAGSGDVLTGIILGLLAQGSTPLNAAVTGTWIHGLAGDQAAAEKGSYSMLAGDLITGVETILKKRGKLS
ncbi:MAG: NAD(P)H-hydrate dehydratase [Blautia sp.]